MPLGALLGCRPTTARNMVLIEAKTYVCGSRLCNLGMEMMGKQGSTAREYLRTALSGLSDPSFCMTAVLIWLVVNAPWLRIKSGVAVIEGFGLEDDKLPYLHA